MYSAKEKSAFHEQFWVAFGKYMSPVASASGSRISWVNYNTGIKPVFFRMHVTGSEAYIGIEIEHRNPGVRMEIFLRFRGFRDSLHFFLGEDWHWEEDALNANGKSVSRIFKRMEPASIYSREDWPAIISFLKPRVIALDAFWFEHYDFFESFK